VVVADDFGRALSVNRAVAAGSEKGVLTAASIMAGGDAFDDAVEVAKGHPALSVGLHVTLSGGRPVLPPGDVPGLICGGGLFEESPARAGTAYWRHRRTLAGQIAAEVKAQFDKAQEAGIRLTHVDCHHHLHMHPLLFSIIAKEAAQRGIGWVRIPCEPLSPIFRKDLSAGLRALPLWAVFGLLARRNRKVARRHGMRTVNNVYGLSRRAG
jgi:predicted glycoside hydrolase/deacetylase ChbG (UPF0249 family)